MNKDEAEKCTRIAKDHLAKGDYESALKFFRKSHKLHEDPVILDLIHRCEIAKSQGSSGPSAPNHQTSQPKATRTENTGSSSASTPKSDPVKSQEIRKLLAVKDFYEILGVSKTSTDDEIKKAYRKLALKFHPDKNKEPGADEAFKKLAQAYDCLMNPDKRRKYDEYGNEEPEQHYRHYRQHYSEDISAEDIFGMFFGNAFFDDQPRRRYVYRQQRHPQHEAQRRAHQHQQGGGNQNMKLLPLLQFLPLLIIIISSFALNFSQEEIPYSFMRTVKHPIQRATRNLKLEYFVDSHFNVNYGQKPSKLVQVEENIEREYISKLISRCQIMTQKKNMIERKAYYSYGAAKENLQKEASSIDLSACRDVQDIRQRFGHLFYY